MSPAPPASPAQASAPAAPAGAPAADAEIAATAAKLRQAAAALERRFLDKGELIRLMLITLLAGEHMVILGPPGTAKSALVRHLARLIDARTFEYLLTRFSEPSELFGPVDIKAFREGVYVRRTESMLPEADIVFLDEIFKSNSAILNSLLALLNERRFFTGSRSVTVPLCSLFGASNDVPNDDALAALFDRFLIRAVSENLDSFHFRGLLERGTALEVAEAAGARAAETPLVSVADLRRVHAALPRWLRPSEEFLTRYKGLVFQIRAEGVNISDRRAVKLVKLFAASALLDGRAEPNDGDFFVLKHVWNTLDQAPLLREIVNPVIERHQREHPEDRRLGAVAVDLDTLLKELGQIRSVLLGGQSVSDVQLFSQLRNLQDVRAALVSHGTETARQMAAEVDKLLEGVFESARWNG
jgi:MoxR-like ATPase